MASVNGVAITGASTIVQPELVWREARRRKRIWGKGADGGLLLCHTHPRHLHRNPPPIRVGVSRVSQLTGYTDIWYYDVVITAEMLPAFTYRIYSTLNTAVSVNQPQVRPPPIREVLACVCALESERRNPQEHGVEVGQGW